MDFEEFKDIIKNELDININSWDLKYLNLPFDIIGYRWIIGGESGGSCWGDEPKSVSSEQEPKFNELRRILKRFYNDISFLEYEDLIDNSVKETEETISGYYGNWTEYRYKWISLKDLFDFFKLKKKI
jgi:hypothetical protein